MKYPSAESAAKGILHLVKLRSGGREVKSIQVSFGLMTGRSSPTFNTDFTEAFKNAAKGTVAQGADVKIVRSTCSTFTQDIFLDKVNGIDI